MIATGLIAAAKSSQDFASLLSVIGAVGAIIAAVVATLQFQELRVQRRVLSTIAEEDREDRVQTMDLPSLQTYLFDTLGAMSIREYAKDQAAQRFVARAVDRVEEYLEEGQGDGAARSRSDHLETAADAIGSGDLVAGLARLRLAIELRLRDVALSAGLPAERAAGGRLIEMLRRADLLDPQTSDDLAYAVKVGNRAVHGETVGVDQAREALSMTRRALASLGGDAGDPRPMA